MCVCIYVCMYTYIYICIHTYIYIYMCVCVSVYMYIYIYVYLFIRMYRHTYMDAIGKERMGNSMNVLFKVHWLVGSRERNGKPHGQVNGTSNAS